jgi:CO/xanthine dehydrogenase Mo-binding subunit
VGIKNIGFAAGFDDHSTARVRLSVVGGAGGDPVAEVWTAAAEMGQGLVTVQAQIARTELGVAHAFVHQADTEIGDAGSSSASRQTWMTGGAVKAACDAVRARLLALAGELLGVPASGLRLADGQVVLRTGEPVVGIAEVLGTRAIEETCEYRPPRRTVPLDEHGQGDALLACAFAAHRAVVDVDVELGLVRVVEIATTQDVGRAINPLAVEGQIEGGTAQGLGLALMEEIQVRDGVVRNPSFTDYLIPTMLDMPPVICDVLELGHPDAPYGLNGVGEPPIVSSPAAVAAAVRAACGRELSRLPIRPDDIVGPD